MFAAEGIINGIENGDPASMARASDNIRDAMMRIPYLKEVMLGAKFAQIAFEFAKKHAPPGAKRELSAAFQSTIMGNLEALKATVMSMFGETGLNTVMGDY